MSVTWCGVPCHVIVIIGCFLATAQWSRSRSIIKEEEQEVVCGIYRVLSRYVV